ncbi:MAG: hypothetical protein H6729_07145 [Deltaproteobacteria bacterium]|nr:hypothetical protein [Deltaproteobacteria bacterium]
MVVKTSSLRSGQESRTRFDRALKAAFGVSCLLVGSALASSTPAMAAPEAEEAPAAAEAPAPAAAEAPAPAAAPAPVAAPAPAPAPAPEAPLVKFYGFIKPALVVSNGVESFGQPNSNSVTAAAHPVAFADNNKIAYSAQVMQSRFGIVVGTGLPVTGKVEIDFADFAQATPTTQIRPRLRVAYVEWAASPTTKVGLGQNWDLFSPLNPNTYNLPGALLGGGGNSAFQRHQLWVISMLGNMELGLAVGMSNANTGSTFNTVNRKNTPTVALRAAYKTADLYAGVSFIGALLEYAGVKDGAPDTKKQASIMANIFAQKALGKGNVKFEAYIGNNGQNIGLLTLSAGRYDKDISEVGGFVSVAHPAGPVVPHASLGIAKILNTDDIGLGYSVTDTGVSRGSYLSGVEYNMFLDFGVKYPISKVALYLDGFVIATRHKLTPTDRETYNSRAIAGGGEVGMLFAF